MALVDVDLKSCYMSILCPSDPRIGLDALRPLEEPYYRAAVETVGLWHEEKAPSETSQPLRQAVKICAHIIGVAAMTKGILKTVKSSV
jgi:hypothetical protein